MLGVEIERALADNRPTMRQRAISAALATLLFMPWFGLLFSALWLAALAAVELIDRRLAKRALDSGADRQRLRAGFLLYMLLATAIWTLLPIRLWQAGGEAQRFVAIIILAIQIMHAQSFGYRSRLVLLLQMGIPALATVWLALSAGLGNAQLMVVLPALIVAIGYVAAGAEANAQAARALDASRAEIERLAYTDATTGLANRRRFAEHLAAMVADGQAFTLVLLDLDGLKQINDVHGHDAGDRALTAFADRLRCLASAGDTVARLGGDEFGWLVAGQNPVPPGQPLCVTLPLGGQDRQMCASVGMAAFPAAADTAETLFKAADVALYAAKPQAAPQAHARPANEGTPATVARSRWSRRPLDAGAIDAGSKVA